MAKKTAAFIISESRNIPDEKEYHVTLLIDNQIVYGSLAFTRKHNALKHVKSIKKSIAEAPIV